MVALSLSSPYHSTRETSGDATAVSFIACTIVSEGGKPYKVPQIFFAGGRSSFSRGFCFSLSCVSCVIHHVCFPICSISHLILWQLLGGRFLFGCAVYSLVLIFYFIIINVTYSIGKITFLTLLIILIQIASILPTAGDRLTGIRLGILKAIEGLANASDSPVSWLPVVIFHDFWTASEPVAKSSSIPAGAASRWPISFPATDVVDVILRGTPYAMEGMAARCMSRGSHGQCRKTILPKRTSAEDVALAERPVLLSRHIVQDPAGSAGSRVLHGVDVSWGTNDSSTDTRLRRPSAAYGLRCTSPPSRPFTLAISCFMSQNTTSNSTASPSPTFRRPFRGYCRMAVR